MRGEEGLCHARTQGNPASSTGSQEQPCTALQREREGAKQLEVGSRAKLEAVESTAAHSSARLAATSQEAQEQLAAERQHSRKLQLEVERVRVVAEVRGWAAMHCLLLLLLSP